MSIDKQLEVSVANLKKAFEILESNAASAAKALRADFGTVKAFQPYPLQAAMNQRYVSNWSQEPLYEVEIAALGKAYTESLPVWEANKAVISAHIELKSKLEAFLESIGLPDGRVYTNPPKSRSRYRSANDGFVKVGWRNSLEAIPTFDTWPGVVEAYKKRLVAIAEAQKKKDAEQAAAQRVRDEENAKLEAEVTRREITRAAGLPAGTEWYQVFSEIVGRNKYLRLAYWLERNRGDWTDGCDYARTGLDGFKVENDTDVAISTCLQGFIDDWGGDGRVFRDCSWSYGRLFELAAEQAPEVFALYQKAAEIDGKLRGE